jgi:Polyketide cyclase / dehydrase and lipid transport
MPSPPDPHGLLVQRAIRIRATPDRVLAAFFDRNDLSAWWEVSQCVTVARPLAPYALQWDPTSFADEVLGKLGGTLHGTMMDVRDGEGFFLADVYYTPPEGAPVGPMALDVQVRPSEDGRSTELAVRMSADDEGPRWQRYFAVMAEVWDRALDNLREHLEWSGLRPPRGVTGREP